MKISSVMITIMILVLVISVWTVMASNIPDTNTVTQKSPCKHTPIAGKFLFVSLFLRNYILTNLFS